MTVAAVVLALWFFTERDDATTSAPATAAAPGQPLRPDAAAARAFSADLERGNLVLLAERSQLAATRALAEDVAGPAEPSVRAAGQAILVRRAEGSAPAPVTAFAKDRTLTAQQASDPALRAFVEYWLGRAAG